MLSAADETPPPQILIVVRSVATVRLLRKVDQTDPLIISDRLNIDADGSGKLANAHLRDGTDSAEQRVQYTNWGRIAKRAKTFENEISPRHSRS